MRKIIFLLFFIFFSFSLGKMFQSVDEKNATIINNGKGNEYCDYCAMDLKKYYKTNHIYKGKQYCSMYSLYAVVGNKMPQNVKVVDVKSLKFIDANNAFYVLGSKVPGTMSSNSKYAFKNREDALDFIQINGGDLVDFETAYAVALNDYNKDINSIRKKKEKKIYKRGKNLYKSKCKNLDIQNFDSISVLKATLKDECKVKRDKELQMITTYLWDVEKLNKSMRKIKSIKVPDDARCPICGMFVKNHPKWVSMIEEGNKKYYFDGVKDMLKFIFKSNKEFKNIYVTDYFTTKKVDARKAYFVVGSDVYGPMGKELVAFESDEAAYNFKNDHFGKKVMLFSQLTDEVLIYLK